MIKNTEKFLKLLTFSLSMNCRLTVDYISLNSFTGSHSDFFQGEGNGWLVSVGCTINGTCPQNVAILELEPYRKGLHQKHQQFHKVEIMKRYLSREFAFISFHNIHNFFIIITPIFGPTKEDRVGGWLSTQSIPSPTKSVPGFNCSFAGRYTISIITFANISCLFTFYLKTLVITHIYMLSSHFTPDWGTYFVFFVITVCSDI